MHLPFHSPFHRLPDVSIGCHEFSKILQRLDEYDKVNFPDRLPPQLNRSAKELFWQADADQDGLVSLHEFFAFYFQNLAFEADPDPYFQAYDQNKNGYIEFNEFKQLLATLGALQDVPQSLHEATARDLFDVADIDGDEAVCRDEFFYFYYHHLAMVRRRPSSSGGSSGVGDSWGSLRGSLSLSNSWCRLGGGSSRGSSSMRSSRNNSDCCTPPPTSFPPDLFDFFFRSCQRAPRYSQPAWENETLLPMEIKQMPEKQLRHQFMRVCKNSFLLDEKRMRASDIDIIFSRVLAEINLLKPYRPHGQILRRCLECTSFTACIRCGRRGQCKSCRACKICMPSKGCTRGDSEFTTARAFYLQFLHGLLMIADKRQISFALVVTMVVNQLRLREALGLPDLLQGSSCPSTCCPGAQYSDLRRSSTRRLTPFRHSHGEDDAPWRSRRQNEA
ncbi:hypothetical protein DUNSADRAFT_10908 [Dunaliella salina]|uniref:EF-hand domain-containing protein n=1 Tax=Dunaliella salina TaxID=3046 RepID=A0ABQ7H4Q9_DUNSA|nr:hypothetical protein DUNSADRAFT_10908 [Dunaliella salina]|eukprot:KAF5841845.1 hypothetical protein DUNSADRAFT_10908 [Dunaliella salina]